MISYCYGVANFRCRLRHFSVADSSPKNRNDNTPDDLVKGKKGQSYTRCNGRSKRQLRSFA